MHVFRAVGGVVDHGVAAWLQHVNAAGRLRSGRSLSALLHTDHRHLALYGGSVSLPTHAPFTLVRSHLSSLVVDEYLLRLLPLDKVLKLILTKFQCTIKTGNVIFSIANVGVLQGRVSKQVL
jgi:hypothetical protein